MISSVIGGAMLPHAPQFFTMPETEDRGTVERVKTAAAEIGARLRTLGPDLWIIFANDHVEQFYHTPLARIAAGNLKSLVGYDAAELDAAGNVELRCWACAAGAIGERKPDIVSLEPSWHHNYASLGWFSPPGVPPEPHYPSIKPELVELTIALHGLAHDEARRAAFLADPAAYADRFRLTAQQRGALIALDTRAIVAMGAHPLVPFLANMQVERQRRG